MIIRDRPTSTREDDALLGQLWRIGSVALSVFVAVGAARVYWSVVANGLTSGQFQDFSLFLSSAMRLVAGLPVYPETDRPGNLNPPILAVVMLPLTWLDPPTAYVVWSLLGFGCLVATVSIVVWTLGYSISAALRFGAVALLSAPVIANLLAGQLACILAVPFTLAWRAARQRRAVAGVWLALVASFKPFLLMFPLVWLVMRSHRVLTAFVATLATLAGAVLAEAGLDAHELWIRRLASVGWEEHFFNASALGLVSRSLSSGAWHYRPLAELPWLRPLAWSLASTTIVALSLRTVRRPIDIDRVWLVGTTAALLVSPLGWVYYGVFLCGPIAGVYGSMCGRYRTSLLVLCCGLLVPPSVAQNLAGTSSGAITFTFGSVYCWAILGLWTIGILSPQPRPESTTQALA